MILFSSSHITMGFDASGSLMWAEWIGAVPGNEFRQAGQLALQRAEQEKPQFWLSNNKQATLLHPADQAWVNEWFIPRLVNTGIQKMAIIIPDEFYNQMILDDIISKSHSIINFEIQYFADEASAREWFLEAAAPVEIISSPAKKQRLIRAITTR